MAIGNTFGATALSSYGGFWISYALILTPSLEVTAAYTGNTESSALGFFLTGWFIFTTILLLCTLRSTVMFFSLFFTLDLAFLFLFCSEFAKNNGAATTALGLQKAGGVFGMLAAFLAWYNAFAGMADSRYALNHPPPPREAFLPRPRMNKMNPVADMARIRVATHSSSSPFSTFRGARRAARIALRSRPRTPSESRSARAADCVFLSPSALILVVFGAHTRHFMTRSTCLLIMNPCRPPVGIASRLLLFFVGRIQVTPESSFGYFERASFGDAPAGQTVM